MRVLGRMTSQAGEAALVIWPETAVPLYVKHTGDYMDTVEAFARQAGSHILTGFPDYERTGQGLRYYNSAMLISPEGEIEGEYRKIHLVPFGEMIPFEERIPLLRNINFGEGDFSPGTSHEIFQVDSTRFAVAICFESIYPDLVRQFVRRGARFIVNITNDEWFGPSAGPYQHAQMAVMRCVEGRVALARCANTGLSMLVDPYGRIEASTELFRRQILVGDLPISEPGTFYIRWGYIVDFMLLLSPAGLALLSYLRRPRPGRSGRNGLTEAASG
jgi:apolipoprotein N-acyltransferase